MRVGDRRRTVEGAGFAADRIVTVTAVLSDGRVTVSYGDVSALTVSRRWLTDPDHVEQLHHNLEP